MLSGFVFLILFCGELMFIFLSRSSRVRPNQNLISCSDFLFHLLLCSVVASLHEHAVSTECQSLIECLISADVAPAGGRGESGGGMTGGVSEGDWFHSSRGRVQASFSQMLSL